MVTCARARLRALPPRAEFLYDADHPATSWLLWGRPPSGPSGPCDPSAAAATAADGLPTGPAAGAAASSPAGCVRASAPQAGHGAAVGSSNAIRGMLHHAVSFEPPPEGAGGLGEEASLNGDTLFVCHYEMPLREGSTERLSLGYAFGGVTNMNGVVAECEAPQLDVELACVLDSDLDLDPTLPSARLDNGQGSPYECFWLDDTYPPDLTTSQFAQVSHDLPRLEDVDDALVARSPTHASAIENGNSSPRHASRSSMSLSFPECAPPLSPPPEETAVPVSPDLASAPPTSTAHSSLTPVLPGFPREQAVPQGRRFAAMLLRNLVYLISVVRIGRHIVMIDLYHVTSDPLAVDIEGRHCNNSIHIMYDPTGMMFGCLSDSTQCIAETLTFLEEVCAVCDVPKAQCPCQSEQVVCANCTSFADLSSRLRGGSTWRHNHMNCERVSLRRSAEEGQQMRRMRTSIWLESVDGLSPHPRTAEMRRRFFNFNGMLVSSPLLIQPSETFEGTDGDSSAQADANDTSSSVKGTTQELCALQYACPSCPKVFIRKAGLQRHKRTVHGPRRHECQQCGAKFQQGAHLKTHQVLVHAKSLNFACDQCGMRFPLRSRLNTHLKNKHGMSAN